MSDSFYRQFVGPRGRGTPEHCGVAGRIDIYTGTMGIQRPAVVDLV